MDYNYGLLCDQEPPRTKAASYPQCAFIKEHNGLNYFPLSLKAGNLYIKQLCDDMVRLQKKMEIMDVYVQSNLKMSKEIGKLQQKIKMLKAKK